MSASLVGSEMCIRDSNVPKRHDIHAHARTLAADYITLRDLKSSDDPLWVEDDFGLPLPQHDSPLLFRFSLHPDDLRRLGLPRLRPSQWNVAPYLLAEAGLATLDRRRLSYSRRAAWYSRRPWYYGPFCTRRGVINTVDALEALGLIGHYRALPGDHLRTGLQSAIWLPSDVMAAMIDAKDLHSQGAQPPHPSRSQRRSRPPRISGQQCDPL